MNLFAGITEKVKLLSKKDGTWVITCDWMAEKAPVGWILEVLRPTQGAEFWDEIGYVEVISQYGENAVIKELPGFKGQIHDGLTLLMITRTTKAAA